MNPLIKVKDLDIIYFLGKSNQVNALSKINAEIYPGEFVIFFGPSGCGKSTLLNAIAGLEQVTRGEVFVAEKNLTKFNQKELEDYRQKRIGMIFQAYYLINSLSVIKNVTLPQLSLNTGLKERETKANQLLEHFGILEQAQKIPSELSGGQQQRVAISRSLINEPEIILADEPTGNLDSKSANDVIEVLRELNAKDKKTVILVTHSPTHLHYAHRVFFMKDGAILEIKVNRELRLTEGAPGTAMAESLVSKDLELLAKTFTTLTGATADQLIPIKAREIVSSALTDMTTEEMAVLNKKVEAMLVKRLSTTEEIFKYLDDDEAYGGLAMNKIQAQNMADKITKIVAEIKVLEEQEKVAAADAPEEAETRGIRQYLFDIFDIKVSSLEAVSNVDLAIKMRLENKIDGAEAQKKFDLPIIKGGAGMDKRTARHAARRLELLILGKYNPDKKDKQPPPMLTTPSPIIPTAPTVIASKTKQSRVTFLSLRAAGEAISGWPRRLWRLAMALITRMPLVIKPLFSKLVSFCQKIAAGFGQGFLKISATVINFIIKFCKKLATALKASLRFILTYDLLDGTNDHDVTTPTLPVIASETKQSRVTFLSLRAAGEAISGWPRRLWRLAMTLLTRTAIAIKTVILRLGRRISGLLRRLQLLAMTLISKLAMAMKPLFFKFGSFGRKIAVGFGDILYNAAVFWSESSSSKKLEPPLSASPILPPPNLPLEIPDKIPLKENYQLSAKTLFDKFTMVSDQELKFMSALNRTLRKIWKSPIRIFYWLRAIVKKVLK